MDTPRLKFALIAAVLILVLTSASAETVTISWSDSSQDTNGQPRTLPIVKHTIYYGMDPGQLANKLDIPGTAVSQSIEIATPGTYYFSVTATTDSESDRTNLASKVVSAPIPQPRAKVTTAGTWAARSGSANIKALLPSHDACMAVLETQPAGTYSCAFSGEKVGVK